MYTQEDLSRPTVLASLGFNQKEINYLEHRPRRDLPSLYLRPYVNRFTDEYRPFDAGLNHLDEITFRLVPTSGPPIRVSVTVESALVTWSLPTNQKHGSPVYRH